MLLMMMMSDGSNGGRSVVPSYQQQYRRQRRRRSIAWADTNEGSTTTSNHHQQNHQGEGFEDPLYLHEEEYLDASEETSDDVAKTMKGYEFFTRVRPYFAGTRELFGGSAAQSPLLAVLDAVLGVLVATDAGKKENSH